MQRRNRKKDRKQKRNGVHKSKTLTLLLLHHRKPTNDHQKYTFIACKLEIYDENNNTQ